MVIIKLQYAEMNSLYISKKTMPINFDIAPNVCGNNERTVLKINYLLLQDDDVDSSVNNDDVITK